MVTQMPNRPGASPDRRHRSGNWPRISHIQRPARNLLDRYGWAQLERLAARVDGF